MCNVKSILLVDEHPAIHCGMRSLLSTENDLEITVTETGLPDALRQLGNQPVDLAIIGLSRGDADEIGLLQRMKVCCPKLKILVYTVLDENHFSERVMVSGADGYLMKTASPAMLIRAIRVVLSGKLWVSPAAVRRIQQKPGVRKKSLVDRLSVREREILILIGQGLETRMIASELGISPCTVGNHRTKIKNKLGLPDYKAVVRFAWEFSSLT